MIPPCPAQAEGEHRAWLHPLSRDKVTASMISASASPGRKDAQRGNGPSGPFSFPLGQQGWCGLSHVLLLSQVSASGSNSQHLHRDFSYFIYASGVLRLNFRPSAMQQAWMLMFIVRLVPEGPSFAQPCACQNFLNLWLILTGTDGEVALGDIQLGDAGSKVYGEVAPLHPKDGS